VCLLFGWSSKFFSVGVALCECFSFSRKEARLFDQVVKQTAADFVRKWWLCSL
jgi:hypothetical protein